MRPTRPITVGTSLAGRHLILEIDALRVIVSLPEARRLASALLLESERRA